MNNSGDLVEEKRQIGLGHSLAAGRLRKPDNLDPLQQCKAFFGFARLGVAQALLG
jgi:hypothetical protein